MPFIFKRKQFPIKKDQQTTGFPNIYFALLKLSTYAHTLGNTQSRATTLSSDLHLIWTSVGPNSCNRLSSVSYHYSEFCMSSKRYLKSFIQSNQYLFDYDSYILQFII